MKKMCDTIIMPDGTEIESIEDDESCLCNNAQAEILTWIVQHIPEIEICETLEIGRTPFGWECRHVKIKYKRGESNNGTN